MTRPPDINLEAGPVSSASVLVPVESGVGALESPTVTLRAAPGLHKSRTAPDEEPPAVVSIEQERTTVTLTPSVAVAPEAVVAPALIKKTTAAIVDSQRVVPRLRTARATVRYIGGSPVEHLGLHARDTPNKSERSANGLEFGNSLFINVLWRFELACRS